jgi:glycosyltransferase involved in cell wall biosynthesis
VAVNGRFLTMTTTGVQRYAREVLARLAPRLGDELVVIVPGGDLVGGGDAGALAALLAAPASPGHHGVRGHAWEQAVLPRLQRRSGAPTLWSPCNWGPLRTRRQVVVFHDIAPLLHPEHFDRAYTAMARVLTPRLVRRAQVVCTSSHVAATTLREHLRVERVHVVRPGVGEPFTSVPLAGPGERARSHCLLVGANEPRKNAAFLTALWPEVHRRTGLELVLTRRTSVTSEARAVTPAVAPGVRVVDDPGDAELARLYADALCVLWPSRYEGYGMPLLEAMATGTPFLSTDVGAARDLAVDPDLQILPLDAAVWAERIEAWWATGVDDIARRSAAAARAQTWEAAAEATMAVLDEVR